MAHTTLVGMLREDGAAKSMGAVMKEIVAAMTAPEETRRILREQIDEACSSKKTTESSRNAEEFKFKVPKHTIEGWKSALRAKRKEPTKEVHFKCEYSINYINTNEASWLDNEEAEGWKAADQAKDEWDAAERERNRNRAHAGDEPYEMKEMPAEKLKAIYENTRRKVRENNRQAKLENPRWEVAQRTQNNDSTYEDKELRFKERDEKNKRDDNRDTDWYQNIRNIAELGETLGYTEKHYKNVLSRFISWFNPELTIVTEKLTADETARFLLRLHTPDTEEEKLEKQIGKLTRKAGTPLRSVMAFLYEIVKAKCKNMLLLEQETEIRKEMVRGLVKFTRGDLQVQLVQSIEYARKKREKLEWRVLMERAIEAEILQGMPQTDIRYQNPDANEAALQKLYNVSVGIEGRPQSKPLYEPGKGGKSRSEEETEPEEEAVDFSDFLGDYPSTSELTKEIKKGLEKKIPKKTRKDTVYESAEDESGEESASKSENSKQTREEKEREIKRLAELLKTAEQMTTRKSARDKKAAEGLGVYNTVTDTDKRAERDKGNQDKSQNRQRTPSSDRRTRTERSSSRDGNRYRNDRNRQQNRRDNRSRDRDQSRSRDRDSNRNNDRRSSWNRNYSGNRDRQSRSTDRRDQWSRDRDRTQSRDRNYERFNRDRKSETGDRGRSRERRQEKPTRANYASTERYRTDSRQRGTRERSDSRNMRLAGITRRNYESQRGITFRRNYRIDQGDMECDKCGGRLHHPWNCDRYKRHAPNECKVCNKGLHHWEVDCMGSFRDPKEPYPRGRLPWRPYSRERTPDPRNRSISRERAGGPGSRATSAERRFYWASEVHEKNQGRQGKQ
jgi:hypothetical protein